MKKGFDLHKHVVMLAVLVFPELALPCLDGHILQKVCISFCLRALEAQLAEEGHHLHTWTRFLLLQYKNHHVTRHSF